MIYNSLNIMALNFSTQTLVDKEMFDSAVMRIETLFSQSLSMLSSLLTEVKSLHSQVDMMKGQLDSLERQLTKMQTEAPVSKLAVEHRDVKAVSDTIIAEESQPEQKAAPVVKRKFFAKYSPIQEVLIELPDSMKEKASFVAEVSGDKGTVRFNKECMRYALSALSNAIYPFFEYDLKSDNPSIIEPLNEVAIVRSSANQWKMEGKISLIIQ